MNTSMRFRIETYELSMNERARFIAVWQYAIHFDHLPSFRLSKVLRLMKLNDVDNPCASNPCSSSEECHQLQNQRSDYICLCPTNFTGTNCSVLDQMCADGFCSAHGLCKPTYRALLSGNTFPHCICSLDRFGHRCGLMYDTCIQNPCQNNGTCYTTAKPDEFVCICNSQFYGTMCELEKQAVRLYFNETAVHAGTVVQYLKINFISLNLIPLRQRIFLTLPNAVFTFFDDPQVPEVILIKTLYQRTLNTTPHHTSI